MRRETSILPYLWDRWAGGRKCSDRRSHSLVVSDLQFMIPCRIQSAVSAATTNRQISTYTSFRPLQVENIKLSVSASYTKLVAIAMFSTFDLTDVTFMRENIRKEWYTAAVIELTVRLEERSPTVF